MKPLYIFLFLCFFIFSNGFAQTHPAITAWLQNNTGVKGRHYVSGNSIPIQDNDSVNVQTVLYSSNWVYVRTKGIPSYITGPFLDGNPSLATSQNAIFKISLNPVANTGSLTSTTAGNIGLFINGVALFDYRDGVAWNPSTNTLCGGPGNPPCPGGPNVSMDWNRDAVLAERSGFDCAKGHPAMGNYHHHQNPSAFDLDLTVLSTICNLYDADGLYKIDSTRHSPLIGFASDGFPIYGAYGYKNSDGTGGITRIQSGYQKRNISIRTTWANGATVTAGPPVSTSYPLGYFREDYEFILHPNDASYLDVHNGRFCVTPEYPAGTYAYFATVDNRWNSAYPYVVGPTFYGVVTASKVSSISEPVSRYTAATTGLQNSLTNLKVLLFPNPSQDYAAVQLSNISSETIHIELRDLQHKILRTACIYPGQTIAYIDVQTLANGVYVLHAKSGAFINNSTLLIQRQ